MNRRSLLKLAPAAAGTSLLAEAQNSIERSRRGTSPLKITKVEALVIRSPNDNTPADELIQMPPIGSTTGGSGLWNRLDHASPSRFFGHTQAVLVKITTDQGLFGWGECHAPAAPRVHQTIVNDLLKPRAVGAGRARSGAHLGAYVFHPAPARLFRRLLY